MISSETRWWGPNTNLTVMKIQPYKWWSAHLRQPWISPLEHANLQTPTNRVQRLWIFWQKVNFTDIFHKGESTCIYIKLGWGTGELHVQCHPVLKLFIYCAEKVAHGLDLIRQVKNSDEINTKHVYRLRKNNNKP